MKKKYIVDLTEGEHLTLNQLTSKGKASVRKVKRAQILLLANEGKLDKDIARALHLAMATIFRIRKRFVERGLEKALSEEKRPGSKRKLDGKQEAFLVAIACSEPPDGRQVWTMQLLADRLIKLEVIDSISDETVRRTLKRGALSPGRKKSGAFQR